MNRELQNFEIKDAKRIFIKFKNSIKERGNTSREYIHGIFYIIVFMIYSFFQDWDVDSSCDPETGKYIAILTNNFEMVPTQSL